MEIAVIGNKYIGDNLFIIPFLKSLRANFDNTTITLLPITNRAYEVFRNLPYISKLVILPENFFLATRTFIQTFTKLPDITFIIPTSFKTALIPYLFNFPNRIGIKKELRGFMLSIPTKFNKRAHMVENYLSLLTAAGYSPYYHEMEYYPSPYTILPQNLLSTQAKYRILIHPGSTRKTKMWNITYYPKLISLLLDNINAHIYLTGSQADSYLCNFIVNNIEENLEERVTSLCGKLSLDEVYLLMNHIDLVISTDNGIIHLAAANPNPRIIGIYISTNPIWVGPYTPPSRRYIISRYKEYKKYGYEKARDMILPENVLEITYLLLEKA